MVSRFIRKEDGVVAVLFALLLPVLIGGVALGVEMGLWFLQRAKLQHVADSAAYSAAMRLSVGGTTAQAQATAAAIVAQGGFDTVNDVTVAPLGIDTAADPDRVTVTLTRDQERFFTRIFLPADPAVSVRAVAEYAVPVTEAPEIGCFQALAASGADTFEFRPNAQLRLPSFCDVIVNSVSGGAYRDRGNNLLEAGCLRLRGSSSVSGTMILANCSNTPRINTGINYPDPYASLAAPSSLGTCITNPDVGSTGATTQLDPSASGGVLRYCNGLFLTGSVTFLPGLYVIEGAAMQAASGASVTVSTPNGATFFFRNGAAPNFGTTFRGSLTAPTTGPYAGVLMFGPTTAPFVFDATTAPVRTMTGGIYAPSAAVRFSGTSGTASLGCFQVVASTIFLNDSSLVRVVCPDPSVSFQPRRAQVAGGGTPGLVRLIQ